MLNFLRNIGSHSEEYDIPSDWRGTEDTIQKMQELVTESKKNWDFFLRLAAKLIENCDYKDKIGELQCIFDFVKNYVRYVYDPYKVELLQSPIRTLQRKAGDCDDLVILFTTLAECIGLRTYFVCVKADKERPDEYSHVFPVVKYGKKLIPADCTVKESYLGWYPGRFFGLKVWKGSLE